MTKSQFNKIMKEVRSIRLNGPVCDEAAFDMADTFLLFNPGLKEFIQKYIGAEDAQGWLANEI
tara:strand:- start:258 stop:446 length:189 start_codon:yes stop_codon:yes gene_type:complete